MPEKKDGKTVTPGARSPVLYFIAALAASAVSLFLMVSNSRTIYGVAGEMHDRHYKLLTATSDLILMDVRLTMAADLAAATGEAGYSREYERLAPELDASIKKIGLLAPEAEGSPYTEAINEANLQLADMERRALRLAGSGKRQEASALLAGREYLNWKKAYSAGVGALLKEYEDSLLAEGVAYRRVDIKGFMATTVIISISILLWVLAAVSARRWLRVRGSTEALVAEKEAEFRHFFDTVQEIFYRVDWKGRLIDITPSIFKYSGFTREELLGTSMLDLYLNKEDREPLLKELLREGMVEDYEVKLRTKDRGVLDVLLNARLLRGFGGFPAGIEGSLRDITARKVAENKLRRMNRLYTILSKVNEAIVRLRSPQKLYEELCRIAVEDGGMKFAWVGRPAPDGLIIPMASSGNAESYMRDLRVSINPSLPEGRGPAGTASRERKIVINSDTASNLDMLLWRDEALKHGLRSSASLPMGEGGIINFYAEETGFFMEDEKPLLASLAEDVTYAVNTMRAELSRSETAVQLERAREQLCQSQKLDALGRLAGGVAHDFNNMLTAILSYAGFLNSSLEPSDHGRGDVGEIIAAAERAATLTGQLLAFSRRQALLPGVFDLNNAISGMESALKELIGGRIELSMRLAGNIGRIKADPGKIGQALRDLAVNARDAITGQGRIIIETGGITFTEDTPGRHDVIPPGRYVRLMISDTGAGMDADTLTHVFEPFFTPKGPGKGAGLGLSAVYGVIKQSGGYILVYSEAGSGTSFKIYFPEVQEPAEAAAEPAPAGKPAGGDETLLLVEDDEQVRGAMARVLRENGYMVIEAPDGEAALEFGAETVKKARLLVTDMVMPKMGGIELAARVRETAPDLPVIYVSGYSEALVAARVKTGENSLFLQNPVDPAKLLLMVREALDKLKK